ncbi:hypothetical protein EVAR_28446_1 [Eumeta japonica]|uniref:Uncharacterized protein n=1 Tax=Eumeta variegata TaxID=151549 RepID=A0A4C1V7Y7_EUMVA|nr:hypothetical protein EVAR_28446_1 [Eumeta japonica]
MSPLDWKTSPEIGADAELVRDEGLSGSVGVRLRPTGLLSPKSRPAATASARVRNPTLNMVRHALGRFLKIFPVSGHRAHCAPPRPLRSLFPCDEDQALERAP